MDAGGGVHCADWVVPEGYPTLTQPQPQPNPNPTSTPTPDPLSTPDAGTLVALQGDCNRASVSTSASVRTYPYP